MRGLMKNHLLTLALVTFATASTLSLAQAPASLTDKAVMPGSTTSPPPLTGGNPNPHEGHASTTCAKGASAEEKNAARPECPQLDSVIPRGVTANNGAATETSRRGTVGNTATTQGR